MMDKLGTLAALQQLDLGQAGSDQQQQQLDQQAQDQAVRQASEMYGIEHQRALLPGQVTAQDLANQQGQFHLAWAQPEAEQRYRTGEADLAAQPAKTAYLGSQSRQNDAQTAMSNAMLAAGEPGARVNSQNAQADALRSSPMMQYYTAGLPFPNGPKPPPGFIESQMAKINPGGSPVTNPKVANLTAKNAELSKLLTGATGDTSSYAGGTSDKHPLVSLALKGILPDYPGLNALIGLPSPLGAAQSLFGEDLYNTLNQGDNLDMNALLLSKSAKTRRQQAKQQVKKQATPTPSYSAAF